MKSEHRHDLETNELARHLAAWIEKIKPHSTLLIGLVGVVLGLILIGQIWSAHAASQEKAAWDAYAMATNTVDPELVQLLRAAEEHPNTIMQEWAYAAWSDRQLQIAAQRYLIDRDAAQERILRVMGIYEALISDTRDQQILDRAHLGLARIYEMQNKLDDAQSEYRKVQGDMAELAEQRATQLESEEVQATCQWLAAVELPKLAPPSGPGIPGERPSFEATPPAASGGESSIDMTKSLEELLGDDESTDAADGEKDRYAEEAGEAETNADSQQSEPSDNTPAEQ